MVWREMLSGDCPRRNALHSDRCDLVCPDLPKVFFFLKKKNCICALRDMCIVEPIGGFVLSKT